MKATLHKVFLFYFWCYSKIKHQRTLMNRKINPNEVYAPSSAKNITYYPIQVKRNQPEEVRPQKEKPYQNITLRTEKYKEKQVDTLRRMNQQLKERQEVYIDKLMKLQEGLQNQHTQFIKLQELYTQLFQSYKQKQAEIAELEHKFRETERYRHFERSQEFMQVRQREQEQESNRSKDLRYGKDIASFKEQEAIFNQSEWIQKQKEWKIRQSELITMNENLTQKLIKLNQKYQKSIQETNSFRSRDKMMHPKTFNQQKLMQQIEHWQSQFSIEKETRIKYQYENDFLKNRNKDLENQREELEQLVAYKQNEIAKLRQQKINIHRQSSQKMMSKSPSRSSRVVLKTIQPTNLTIDEQHSNESRQSENENGLSQQNSKSRQYFSFSRDKKEILQQQLPNFPQQLQIDSLIKVHKNE